MAEEKPKSEDGRTGDAASPPMESFGPVTSLEPDAATPLAGGGRAGAPERKAGAGPHGKGDWSHAAPPDAGEESEDDPRLLDSGFLKRTFKEVKFPASKELCLRFVDQEQDFAYGQDRTVNLHNLIAHIGSEEFATRRDLLKAIKERLALHHGAHPSA